MARTASLDLVIHSSVRPSLPYHFADFQRAARFLDPELADEVEGLMEELELEFWGAERVIDEAPP